MGTTYTSQAVTDGLLPYSTVLALDGFLAAVEDTLALASHPAVVDCATLLPPQFYVGAPTNASYKIPIDFAVPLMASTAETTDVAAATTIDYPTQASISTGAYDLSFGVSDELRRRDPVNGYQVVRIAGKMASSAQYTVTSLICALADSATTTVGTSGTPLTWDTCVDARDEIVAEALGALEEARFALVLHPQQWRLIRQDLGSATGARAERRELDQAQMGRPVGYQGTYDDIDVYTCDRVAESGGDYSGLLMASGGIGRLFVPPAAPAASEIRVLDLSPVCAVEEVRNGADKSIQLNAQMTVGVAILRQTHIRRVLSTGAA
jgi:hypothetical protein